MADNDLDDLGLPFCDVLLSDLTISPGTLTPQFGPSHTEYTAEAGSSPVTITPTNDHNARFEFLDGNDVPAPDADGALDGHKVKTGRKNPWPPPSHAQKVCRCRNHPVHQNPERTTPV